MYLYFSTVNSISHYSMGTTGIKARLMLKQRQVLKYVHYDVLDIHPCARKRASVYEMSNAEIKPKHCFNHEK